MRQKIFLWFAMLGIAAMLGSCATTYSHIGGSSLSKKDLKEVKIYKTSFVESYNKRAFDLVLRAQKDYKKISRSADSTVVMNEVYAELFSLFSEYFDKEYRKFYKEMGMSVLSWKREFVKLKFQPWEQMPKASHAMASQFDAYITEASIELNKSVTSTFVTFRDVESAAFIAPFIDKTIKAFLGEYTEKASNPVITKSKKNR